MSKAINSIEAIAKLYPLLFSQKRLDEWFNLFDERAMIVRVEDGQPVTCQNINDAMPEQLEYADENDYFKETWENIEIYRYGNIGLIKASYTLAVDTETRKGIDVLTVCQDGEEWRITSLTYEQTEYIRK